MQGWCSQEPVQAGAASESSAPIYSHTSLPVTLVRAVVRCWGLAVQRGRPAWLGDSEFSLTKADRVHLGGLQDSLGGNQAGRLHPWQGFSSSAGAGTSILLTDCRVRLPGCCPKPLLDVGSHSEVAPAAPTHPRQLWLLSPLISQPSIPPSTEVGVHLIDSVRPLGEGRQGLELDHETQG